VLSLLILSVTSFASLLSPAHRLIDTTVVPILIANGTIIMVARCHVDPLGCRNSMAIGHPSYPTISPLPCSRWLHYNGNNYIIMQPPATWAVPSVLRD